MPADKMRIVVKVGTSTLTHELGSVNLKNMDKLVRVLCDLSGMGHEMILVSSGAIAVGTEKLGLPKRPTELAQKQAVAGVGQCQMMHLYDKFFNEYNRTTAQILLTVDDIQDPERAKHLISTFETMIDMGVIPVVNENDSVTSNEIETMTDHNLVLGDNDKLSAIVASLLGADLLVLLSDIEGLYNNDPRIDDNAELIHRVDSIDDEIRKMAGGAGSWRGTGGMATKLDAAQIAMNSGCDMVITNGKNTDNLYGIVEGKEIGTRFYAKGF